MWNCYYYCVYIINQQLIKIELIFPTLKVHLILSSDSIKEPQEEQIHYQIPETPEVKANLLPMETDVISSEEDDILARESPESNLKSSPPSEVDFVKVLIQISLTVLQDFIIINNLCQYSITFPCYVH